MVVRCGRCRAELDVSGSGEFVCPRCGTRNVVRAPAAPAPGFGVPDLTIPGGSPASPPVLEPDPAVRWLACPECSWRFASGVVSGAVICPNCRQALSVDESGMPSLRA